MRELEHQLTIDHRKKVEMVVRIEAGHRSAVTTTAGASSFFFFFFFFFTIGITCTDNCSADRPLPASSFWPPDVRFAAAAVLVITDGLTDGVATMLPLSLPAMAVANVSESFAPSESLFSSSTPAFASVFFSLGFPLNGIGADCMVDGVMDDCDCRFKFAIDCCNICTFASELGITED
uniref:Uncharacterized protein n=1 Tax=Anopheles melas TaxID=34690 RepID=A0A182U0P3_9DIPT